MSKNTVKKQCINCLFFTRENQKFTQSFEYLNFGLCQQKNKAVVRDFNCSSFSDGTNDPFSNQIENHNNLLTQLDIIFQ